MGFSPRAAMMNGDATCSAPAATAPLRTTRRLGVKICPVMRILPGFQCSRRALRGTERRHRTDCEVARANAQGLGALKHVTGDKLLITNLAGPLSDQRRLDLRPVLRAQAMP